MLLGSSTGCLAQGGSGTGCVDMSLCGTETRRLQVDYLRTLALDQSPMVIVVGAAIDGAWTGCEGLQLASDVMQYFAVGTT